MDDVEKTPVDGSKINNSTQVVREVNASGHVDQLKRQYSVVSICATAVTIDNAWMALGGTLVVASANGGPPGIIYEYLAACLYYAFIAASVAELSSSIPSSGGVYHWASATPGPRYGRALGFFTGALNFFGWFFALTSVGAILANIAVQMYAIFHPAYVPKPWHIFVGFCVIIWSCCLFVIFFNSLLPMLQNFGAFLLIGGGLITIIVVLTMQPHHASNAFVWTQWTNTTGWSGGIAFLTGMLNGAYGIGTPDAVSHMAEEMPNPRRDLPKAVVAQMTIGTLTGFFFVVSVMYGITDFSAIINSGSIFPLAEMYLQATSSKGATFGLLLIVFLGQTIATLGVYVTVGRMLWALARDNVTPYSSFLGKASEAKSCPIEATVFCATLATAVGAIQLGSATTFSDIVGSFVTLTTASYFLPIFGHLVSGRKNIPRGPFWMGKWGFPVNAIAAATIVVTDVFYCFPFAIPFTTSTMNYNSVILAGCVFLTSIWWLIHGRRHYKGVILPHMEQAGKQIDELK